MSKYFCFFLIYIISFSLSAFIPMKKNKNFKEDVCAYSESSNIYVKPCEDGKYCEMMTQDLGHCLNVENKIEVKSLNDDCTSDFECDYNLECDSSSKKCALIGGCTSGNVVKTNEGAWVCRPNTYDGLCFYRDVTSGNDLYKYSEYNKVCGIITFEKKAESTTDGINYEPKKIETAYIGSVEDGKYVFDERACKSGYALYFYPDNGNLIDPGKNGLENKMYKRCISPNGIEKNSFGCVIKYDNDKIYNVDQLLLKNREVMYKLSGSDLGSNSGYDDAFYTSSYSSPHLNEHSSFLCDDYLMIKKEMFNKYINLYTVEKQKECEKDGKEPFTCGDNEIRKWYYFYKHPEYYTLYYDEDNKNNDITNFLLQQEYKAHISGKFLYNKYFAVLSLLLLFF